MVEDLVIKLFDYGLAGVALYLLFKIANSRLTEISLKLDKLTEKIDKLLEELREGRE